MENNFSHNENQLLKDISEGKKTAFESLFNEWYPRLLLYAETFSVTRPEAEEIVSDAFTKFWLSRTNFDALNKIKSFLYTVSRNAALNVVRSRKLHGTADLEDPQIADEDGSNAEMLRMEVIAAVFREIELLPDRCRQVVLLTYREGLSSQQIADRLGVTVSTVTSQRARAIQLLKISLADKFPLLVLGYLPDLLRKILH